MELAMGVLGWSPETFWHATPPEFWSAFDGWSRINAPSKGGKALTDEEIETLEDMKRRFPDDPRAKPIR